MEDYRRYIDLRQTNAVVFVTDGQKIIEVEIADRLTEPHTLTECKYNIR